MAASTHRRLSDHGNRSGGFQHRPSAIVCPGCGGQYFAASLPIHQKTCFERNPFVNVACPECRAIVKSGKLRDHGATCPGPQRITHAQALVAKPSTPDTPMHELNAPEGDGRVRCRNCDRAFHAERIAKHQSVCVGTRRRARQNPSTPSTSKKPAGRVRSPITSASPVRRRSYVARIRGVSAVSMQFSGAPSAAAALSRNMARGRDVQTKRFDLVHRDGTRCFESYGATGGGGQLNLSMSTATSASNPLATTRLMTMRSW